MKRMSEIAQLIFTTLRSGPMTSAEIAARIGEEPNTVSVSCGYMVQQKWIEKDPSMIMNRATQKKINLWRLPESAKDTLPAPVISRAHPPSSVQRTRPVRFSDPEHDAWTHQVKSAIAAKKARRV